MSASEQMSDVAGLTEETVWVALRDVMDPELPISIVDLGLVYAVRVEGSSVDIDLTFTASACPCVDFIQQDIRTRLQQEPAVETININIVWDPPWTKNRLSELARAKLREFGVSS